MTLLRSLLFAPGNHARRVAKALTQRMSEHTIFTETGQMIGTPEYASPEQVSVDESGVDQRSDVYSLGVTLYELLVGSVPFGANHKACSRPQ